MNVLIIGLGSIAKKHIAAIHALGLSAKIFALRSDSNAPIYEGVVNIQGLNEVNCQLDFAIISNPTNLHYHFIDLIVDQEIPLFIEKPPLSSLENADILQEKIEKKQVKTYVACNLRFNPCVIFLKNFLLQNQKVRINEVNIYAGSYLPEWRPSKDFREVYSANAAMGGGVHLDLFHELDYTTWIFGKPYLVYSTKRNVSSLAIDAYDYANYTFCYKTYTASIILNYYRKDSKRNIEIVFDNETWNINLLLNKIVKHDGGIVFEAPNFSMAETYYSQMQYFINCLMDDRVPMNTFAESLETLKICLINEQTKR